MDTNSEGLQGGLSVEFLPKVCLNYQQILSHVHRKYLGDILNVFELFRKKLEIKKPWEFTETYLGDLSGIFVSRPSHALFHYVYHHFLLYGFV